MKKCLSLLGLLIFLLVLKNNVFADWICGTFASDSSTKYFYFSRAIQKDPDYALPYRSRAWTELRQKNYPAATKDFETALKLNPVDCVSWYGYSELKRALKDWEGALKNLEQALQLNPRYLWAHLSRAECFDQTGNAKAALESRVRYLQLSGNLQEALFHLDEFLSKEIDKKSRIQTLEWRANIKTELKDTVGAILDWDQVILLHPRYARAYFKRGILKKRMKKKEEALKDFHTALEKDPHYANNIQKEFY